MLTEFLSGEACVAAFYGIQRADEQALKEFCDLAIAWCNEIGCEPHLLGTSRFGRKYKRFGLGWKKLSKEGFAGLTFIELVSMPAEANGNEFFGQNSHAIANLLTDEVIFSTRQSLSDFENQRLREVVSSVAKIFSPKYGIGYRREFQYGPSYFAMGGNMNQPANEDNEYLRRHVQNLQHKYYASKGLLSNLHTWNMLTRAQLDRHIGEQTLSEWIRSLPCRGTLSRLTDEMQLWELTDEQIAELQPVLQAAGCIIDSDHEWDLRIQEAEARGIPKATPEEALAAVMQAFGFDDPDQVDIVQHDKPGKSRPLSDNEKKAVYKKQPKKKKQ